MKNNIKFIACCATLCMISSTVPVLADDGSSGVGFYEMIFGNPDQRNLARAGAGGTDVSSENCDGYGGLVGDMNSFFCHMEKDMGITGPGSATKTFGGFYVHAEIDKTATTVNSVTYDYVAELWVCDSSSADCTQTTSFSRVDYIAFSYDKTAGINKGYAINSPGALAGAASGAMEIIYDVGSSSASQSVSARMTFSDGTTTYNMRVLGAKTASTFTMNLAGYDGSNGFRFAMSGLPPTSGGGQNYYNMYFEAAGGIGAAGFYTLDTAGLAAPATAHGQCVSATEQGTTTTISMANGNCGAYDFSAFDEYAITSDGTPSVQAITTNAITGSWQGMPANPTSL